MTVDILLPISVYLNSVRSIYFSWTYSFRCFVWVTIFQKLTGVIKCQWAMWMGVRLPGAVVAPDTTIWHMTLPHPLPAPTYTSTIESMTITYSTTAYRLTHYFLNLKVCKLTLQTRWRLFLKLLEDFYFFKKIGFKKK